MYPRVLVAGRTDSGLEVPHIAGIMELEISCSNVANSAPLEFAFCQRCLNAQNNITMLTLIQNKQLRDGNYRL